MTTGSLYFYKLALTEVVSEVICNDLWREMLFIEMT